MDDQFTNSVAIDPEWARYFASLGMLHVKRGRARRARATRLEREKAGPGFTKEQFAELCKEYNNCCACCYITGKLVPDHITPLYRGGKHEIGNIQPLCSRCNLRKGIQIIRY